MGEGEIAKQWAQDIPMLMLFRQKGDKGQGLAGRSFLVASVAHA